jgi:acetyltransferase-like isoleucine patch superfamily enzyme
MRGFSIMLGLKIVLLFTLVYTGALFVPALIFKLAVLPLAASGLLFLPLAAMLSVLNFVIFIIAAILCSGAAARVFRLKYSGRHRMNLSNKQVANWLLTLVIYLPIAVVLDFFHLYPLKTLHIRMFGGKIGKNVIVGGLITDPCLLEVGDNANIGGFSTVLCHAVERSVIRFKPVKIGRECGVGTRATILAGAVMEDRSFLAAQSFLPKNQVIPQGKIYGGVPARIWEEPVLWGGEKNAS